MNKSFIKFMIFIFFVFILIIVPSNAYANSDIIVMLDPGHGGSEPGAQGGNLVEKDLTWKIANRVKQILDNTSNITGILTKGYNETLSRKERAERGVQNNADLLISFHINSSDSTTMASGAEVYVTHDRTQRRYFEYSNKLGVTILDNLKKAGIPLFAVKPKVRVGTPDDIYPDGTIADYYGIISWPMHNDIPAVLVEHCFINNPIDREKYLNDEGLNRMAEADAKSIIECAELFRRNYEGNINTELLDINSIQNENGDTWISGYVYVAEWVGNDCRTPREIPKITLKSIDGTISKEMYVAYTDGIKYYFDKNINGLDINKEYYIEVELQGDKNLAPIENKIQTVRLPNKILIENYKNKVLKSQNNKLVFEDRNDADFQYEGTINTELYKMGIIQNNQGDSFISGKICIAEWVNGECRIPKTKPSMILKSTDNTYSKNIFINHENGIEYYYDVNIEKLDITKEYYIEVKLTCQDNISLEEYKTQIAKITPQGMIGRTKNTRNMVVVDKNTIKIQDKSNYYGTINTELYKMNIIQNSFGDNYISGMICIAEWVDNECRTPVTLPEIKLKSVDGLFETNVYIDHVRGIEYYFDKNIEGLDIDKKYYLEVRLTDSRNISLETSKTQIAKITLKGLIGICTNGRKVSIEKNIIKIYEDTYYGTINTELYKMNIIQNNSGDNYISGFIYIAEWVNGECRTPSNKPQIMLKSTDGEFATEVFVNYENGIRYYFDKNIEGIDVNKQYYLEVRLVGTRNIAPEESKIQTAKISLQGKIGTCTNGNEVFVIENKIKIIKSKG